MRDSKAYRVLWRAGRANGGALGYPARDEDLQRLLAGDRGFKYEEKRAMPGDVVTDLPAKSVPGLLKAGAIMAEADEDALAAPYLAALGLAAREASKGGTGAASAGVAASGGKGNPVMAAKGARPANKARTVVSDKATSKDNDGDDGGDA